MDRDRNAGLDKNFSGHAANRTRAWTGAPTELEEFCDRASEPRGILKFDNPPKRTSAATDRAVFPWRKAPSHVNLFLRGRA
jgi:hypothetical protein